MMGSMRVAWVVLGVVAMSQVVFADEVEQKKAALAEARQKAFEQCMSTDKNCEYGTSTNCAPSVPYTDRWAARFQIQRALDEANRCPAPSSDMDPQWSKCLPKVLEQIPNNLITRERDHYEKVWKRNQALPSDLACKWEVRRGSGESISQARFWCGNLRTSCVDQLPETISVMEDANRIEECVYNAEFAAGRRRTHEDREAKCKKDRDDQEKKDEQTLTTFKTQQETNAAKQKETDEANAKRQDAIDKKRQDDAARAAEEEQRRQDRARAIIERYQTQRAEADATNAKYASDLGTAMGSLHGGGNHPQGTSRHTHLEVGLGFEVLPIFTNTYGSDVPKPYSSGTSTLGLGPHFLLSVAPYHSARFTIAGYGAARIQGMATAGGTMAVIGAEFGLQGAVGPEHSWQLAWKLGYGRSRPSPVPPRR